MWALGRIKWTSYTPPASGSGTRGKVCGPDLPDAIVDEIAKIKKSIREWRAQADKFRNEAEQLRRQAHHESRQQEGWKKGGEGKKGGGKTKNGYFSDIRARRSRSRNGRR